MKTHGFLTPPSGISVKTHSWVPNAPERDKRENKWVPNAPERDKREITWVPNSPERDKRKHYQPTNPEWDLELQGMETFQSGSIGRWAVAMPKISMAMILCQGLCCAALRCAAQ